MADTRFVVRFDEATWAEDLAHATPAARAAAERTRERIEAEGAREDELRRCQPEGRDGTRLPGCVKLYVPDWTGPWRIVFRGARPAGRPTLAALAFGEAHPRRPARPSVYQIAHRRLHGAGPQ